MVPGSELEIDLVALIWWKFIVHTSVSQEEPKKIHFLMSVYLFLASGIHQSDMDFENTFFLHPLVEKLLLPSILLTKKSLKALGIAKISLPKVFITSTFKL